MMSIEVDQAQLIETIKKNPCLYNRKHKDYKNNHIKEECWKNISVEVNIPVEDCKRLWRNLTNRFTKDRRRQLADSTARSEWEYYDEMSFYSEYSSPRKTVINPTKVSMEQRREDASSNSETVNDLDEDSELATELSESELQTSEEEELSATTQTSPPAVYRKLQGKGTCTNSKQTATGIKQESSSASAAVAEVGTAVSTLTLNCDVNESFGLYVISHLKQVHPDIAKEKRKIIQAVLEDI
ncbi:hypothetical protein NQ315_010527 [Exocentrus adspersus]|uniref:MADF domain-containing protein n=1 Tax=Exocentrus adspersus TaxID=1586481 RepID=A0AAV8W5A9_9CUCU|nr:hypothetical protein NQ315_010527 [Exocentrus adspersus]